jgi:hypothetical protein
MRCRNAGVTFLITDSTYFGFYSCESFYWIAKIGQEAAVACVTFQSLILSECCLETPAELPSAAPSDSPSARPVRPPMKPPTPVQAPTMSPTCHSMKGGMMTMGMCGMMMMKG